MRYLKILTLLMVILGCGAQALRAQVEKGIINMTEGNLRDALPDTKVRSIELERIRNEARRGKKSEKSFPRIREDFEQIQIVNTEKIQLGRTDSKKSRKAMLKGISEVRKRAYRLGEALFPDFEKYFEDQQEADLKRLPEVERLKIALDNSIYRFVNNPIFRTLKVVEPAKSLEAEKELVRTVIYCDLLGRAVDRIQ